ncbi:MAG: hypothetical protein GOVbin4296_16 [Prokaryotic dsDNA virus sp.]|nr:MAG: hypothetical protein GOVbin4296_16 [Prokaryotic dsDNA virus sp.]|tara:strand:- start:2202 stop:2393 length:192 start_codon:yes stop_codon:yes gene_type:complete
MSKNGRIPQHIIESYLDKKFDEADKLFEGIDTTNKGLVACIDYTITVLQGLKILIGGYNGKKN